MRINGNAIRPGNIIEHKGGLWQAVKIQHTQPGKGGAYLQVELKNLRDGTKLNERFRAAENVEKVRLDEKQYQFLYADGDLLTFMETETYEQITLDRDLVGEQAVYLQDGVMTTVMSYEDEPLTVQVAETVILAVTETEAVIKGQTAAGSFKPAILENGVRTMVPPHIETGTRVVIATADGVYRERARD
jgi:elongation factor P